MSRQDFKRHLRERCEKRWADLTPRGDGRYCNACDTVVLDVSRLSQAEAEERIRGGRCVRVRFDDRGAPLFREPPERRPGRALVVLAALAGGCASARAEPSDRSPAPHSREVAPLSAPPLEPMRPVPSGVAFEELGDAERASLQEAIEAARGEPEPTPEQIALTAAKRHRRHRAAPAATAAVPPPYEWLGGAF